MASVGLGITSAPKASLRQVRGYATIAGLLVALVSAPAVAGPFGLPGQGWYARGEIGGALQGQDRGYWEGPGVGAPRITFGLDHQGGVTGSAAIGYDWMNGVRSDLSFILDSNMDVTASILSASNGSSTSIHTQTITSSANAQALMANVFIEPFKMAGNDGAVQPFITGGVGVAHVSMGRWTRYNPTDVSDVYRTFNGADQFNLAWSVGGGLSFRLGDGAAAKAPRLELAYRLSDFGNVSGSTTPSNGNGSLPQEPFNFDYLTHSVTVGLRVPIN